MMATITAYTVAVVSTVTATGVKGASGDAESGKGTTVMDIKATKFTQEPGTKYITKHPL